MKTLKFSKENISLVLITILSAILNFGNLGIEGTSNTYYTAAVKSMTKSFKNFFFVSFDPTGFVSIDKPPLGFWFQAISAKIFGFNNWSILLPQALAGVLSVLLLYKLVKKSFGYAAGLIAALCMAITPIFVAISRNNSIDNTLVLFLLLACWALSIAAEKGKLKYLIISMVLLGLGFNIKMLEAYMIVPALYVTYLFASAIQVKKRFIHLAIGTVILLVVSMSWAIIVDLTPASKRPYVDSSTNNTVTELIIGHNGMERLGLGSSSIGGRGRMKGSERPSFPGSNGMMQGNPPSGNNNGNWQGGNGTQSNTSGGNGNFSNRRGLNRNFQGGNNMSGNFQGGNNMPSGFPKDFKMGSGMRGGMGGGSFGSDTKAGITRLFVKGTLSDQIIWFIPLALLGFIACAIKEKLKFRLDNIRKQSLVLWIMWFVPVFIYFSFTTGLFHPYYLTMLAPPICALTGIGLVSMWELYKEGSWKSWFLPAALIVNGAVQLIEIFYYSSSSNIVKVLFVLVIVLCFGASIGLSILNLTKKKPIASDEKTNIENNIDATASEDAALINNPADKNISYPKNLKLKKSLLYLAVTGLLVTPLVGSSTVLFYKLNGSMPAAGLELLSNNTGKGNGNKNNRSFGNMDENGTNSKMVKFLLKNKTKDQKYLLVVSRSQQGADIIINTNESVMALGGFMGSDNSITLSKFKELVEKGEIRYVLAGGMGGDSSSNSQIMNWVQKVGKVVPASKYGGSTSSSRDFGNFNAGNMKMSNGANFPSFNRNSNSKNSSSQSNEFNRSNRFNGFGGFSGANGFGNRNSGGLYDLKSYTDSLNKNKV